MEESAEQTSDTVATAPRRLEAADVARMENSTSTILVRTGPGLFDREIRIRSHEVARGIAAALGVAIGVVTIFWFRNAWIWLDPCRDTPAGMVCSTPTAWFRLPQFLLAAAGLVTGAAISTYLVRFSIVGHIWRNSRQLAVAHGLIVVTWLFVWAIGTFAR